MNKLQSLKEENSRTIHIHSRHLTERNGSLNNKTILTMD